MMPGSEGEDETGLIFDIQRFSLQDGPGIRTTLFMKGCPLRCRWCGNPESWNARPEIWYFQLRCNRCGKCVDKCMAGAIQLTEDGVNIDRDRCNLCFDCVDVCPTLAIERTGQYITADDAFEQISKDIPFYNSSEGGVTVSGGEPLAQPDFVCALLKKCKENGLHTVLDTTGHAPWGVVERCLKNVDLVLFDIKSLELDTHKLYTGVSNELILENVTRVASRVSTWLRIPLIPGVNSSESQIADFAEFARKIPFEKVCLLPLHHWGQSKYERLGRNYFFKDVSVPDADYIKKCKKIMETHGLKVEILD